MYNKRHTCAVCLEGVKTGSLSFMKLPRILMIVFWSRPFDQDHWKCMNWRLLGCYRVSKKQRFKLVYLFIYHISHFFFHRSLSNQDEVMKSSLLNPICYCFLTALAHLAKIILTTTEWMASQNGFMIHFSFVHVSFGLQEEDADYACTPCTTTQSFKDSNPTQYHKEANDSLFL